MKNLLFVAIFGFALLFVNGIYAQNEPPPFERSTLQVQAHPMDAPRYDAQPSPMQQKYPSAPTVKPGGQH